jgi:hypothetical protein
VRILKKFKIILPEFHTAFLNNHASALRAYRDFRGARLLDFHKVRVYDDMNFALFEENDSEA